MEEKKVVPMWLSAVVFVLAIASIVIDFIEITHSSQSILLPAIDIIVVMMTMFYCIASYTKSGSTFYKAFCVMFLISKIVVIPKAFINHLPAIIIILMIAKCVLAAVLAFVPNLGYKLSYIFIGAIVVISIVDIFVDPNGYVSGIFGKIAGILIPIIYGILVYAKYKDKKSRGTT